MVSGLQQDMRGPVASGDLALESQSQWQRSRVTTLQVMYSVMQCTVYR